MAKTATKKKPSSPAGEPVLTSPSAGDGSWVEHVRLSEIRPALRNPKEHDEDGIAASIRRYGFVAPLVENAESGRIAAGHGRLAAARQLYAEDPKEVPRFVKLAPDGEWMIPVLKGIAFPSEQAAEEYLIAVNRWVEKGGWDPELLAPMLERLSQRADKGELAAIGWSEKAIGRYLADFDASTAARGKTPAGLAEGYNAGAVKQIVVYFPAAETEAILGRLSRVMRREKVGSNSEALERLISRFEQVRKLKPLRGAA